jgi:uncharacterized membrane protein YhhN
MATIALLVFLVIALVDWMAVAQESKSAEYVAKPAALAALLVFAATGEGASSWLIAALALSLLGDVYLMLPANLFAAGLGAFLLGHLAYICDFEASLGWRVFWWLLLGGASVPMGRRIVAAVVDEALRPAVVVYMAVLAFMVGSAIASGSVVAALGALLFYASDSLLAWNRFVQPVPQAHLWVMITYHLGQLGLVVALR